MADKFDKATALDDSDLDAVAGGVELTKVGGDQGTNPDNDNKVRSRKGGTDKGAHLKANKQKLGKQKDVANKDVIKKTRS